MVYKMNYTGVNEAMSRDPLPDGSYNVKIEKIDEKIAKSGRPLIKVRYKVISGPHAGRLIFDYVVLFAGGEPGAGMTMHFLKVIGQPHEGNFDVEPKNWIDKELSVSVITDPAYNSNKVKAREKLEEIPF